MRTLFINIIGFSLVFSSILTITTTNPVISVIFLICTFVSTALYLILIGVHFVGISYVVVYVGAIAVLFLFVIMMININITDIVETGSNYTKNFPLSIIIITLFIYLFKDILNIFYYNPISNLELIQYLNYDKFINIDKLISNFEQIQLLGYNLYAYGAICFIILSIILLLAHLISTSILEINQEIAEAKSEKVSPDFLVIENLFKTCMSSYISLGLSV